MTLDVDEALRYLGIRNADPALHEQAEAVARRLTTALQPRYIFRICPLQQTEEGFRLQGTALMLPGQTARTMLEGCHSAALLACTLGTAFDTMLRREQARDMADAVILDACGGAWVEAGCEAAESDLKDRLPGKYLTDRFSPGYGDLPLALQPDLCTALDARRRLGIYVTESLLMNPMKSVTAVIGIADRPRMARIRGCAFCSLRETCTLRKGGNRCGLSSDSNP